MTSVDFFEMNRSDNPDGLLDPRASLKKELHKLPFGWRWEWFTDVLGIEGGTQPPASAFVEEPKAGYVRLVQIRDFDTDAHLTYIPDSSKWRKCTDADVLIGRYGAALGRICRGLSGAYNVALAKVIPSAAVATDFAFYLLKSRYFQQPILSGGDRSAQAGFNKSDLAVIALPIPPLDEQMKIAHILGSLDDKIELNRRMSQTLEEIARALFKSWFVDFDPVHAKAAGRQPVGMDAETAALFPSEFEDSELGLIPKGWRAGAISDFAELNPESWTNHNYPPNVSYIDLSNTKFGQIESIAHYTRKDAPSRAQRILHPGDTIIGTVRPGNGSFAYVAISDLTGSTGFAVLRPRDVSSREFVYFGSTSPEAIETLAHLADGAAYPAVRPSTIASLPIAIPPDQIVAEFHRCIVDPVQRISGCQAESITLAAVRDSFLPRLLSGELRIPSTTV